ncbi:MAG: SprT family zinc-dependent metalloprotease [Albidovulum sp.]
MHKTLAGDPPVELTLRRSARARRFSLRVSRLDGRVTLSMPPHAAEAEAMAFAESQAEWIRRNQGRAAQICRVELGTAIPLEGRMVTLVAADLRAPQLLGDQLLVPPDPARMPIRVMAYLKLQARQRLQAASDHYAQALGRRHAGLVLRDTRSRWGSCAADGQLMYSWRLIMAPPDVLDYVAAHEVAHLAEMNHSPAFWAVVRRLMPGYEVHRRWLKTKGNALHGYDFVSRSGE